ncbi:MAG TPA: hypothetical protein VII41_12165, partial [Steroidobacteraceae bacterium]
MSPLWRDEIGAYLAPHRLCLARLKRGIRASLAAEEDIRLPPAAAGDWSEALRALGQRLAQPSWQAARLRLVIADHWVRYTVVQWSAELSSPEESLAHARELLASVYGDALSDWVVSLSDAPPGVARVACAMPRALLDALTALTESSGMHLTSLQPQLVAAYNGWRHRLPQSAAWFVTVDEGSLAAARVGSGGFERVHTVRIGSDWTREIKRLQIFGRLVNRSVEAGPVFIDAPQTWRQVA